MSATTPHPAVSTDSPRPVRARLPFNTFGIAFGLSGLAGAWTATAGLGAPEGISDVLWVVAALAWIVTIVRYAAAGTRPRDVVADLRHPVLSPFAALVPVTGSLLSARLSVWLPTAGEVLMWSAFAVSAAFGGWFIAGMLVRPRDPGTLHGGYLLPTVAASLITSQSLATIGHPGAAKALFGAGILFWVLIGAMLLSRFTTGPEMPRPLLPTLAIFSAPPAVAGNAWWVITEGRPGTVHELLLGTMAALLLPHLFLIRAYVRLPFALGFWALTFTTAASATYGVRLLSLTGAPWRTPLSWVVVGVATAVIGAVAVRSLALVPFRRILSRRTAGRTTETASVTC
ncbi:MULTISPECIES: C4-dicarboxylate transporter [Streptomyces]|uniref:SLAC1 family transporter n=1 Tax=Streptomyces TaxID=1883 RepID=UPI0004BD48CE|nr:MULTISPECIES: C4-dicarboxylate transporter [Streptomyces]